MTDKDSLYRKLYNRSLPFFVWVIEQEPAPFIFKLHIQAMTLKELTITSVRQSIEVFLNPKQDKVSVQFFAKKKQFKVFVTIKQKADAVSFFERVFRMKELTIIDMKEP